VEKRYHQLGTYDREYLLDREFDMAYTGAQLLARSNMPRGKKSSKTSLEKRLPKLLAHAPLIAPDYFYLVELKGSLGRGGGDRKFSYLRKAS
jgi:hypothetical protein